MRRKDSEKASIRATSTTPVSHKAILRDLVITLRRYLPTRRAFSIPWHVIRVLLRLPQVHGVASVKRSLGDREARGMGALENWSFELLHQDGPLSSRSHRVITSPRLALSESHALSNKVPPGVRDQPAGKQHTRTHREVQGHPAIV